MENDFSLALSGAQTLAAADELRGCNAVTARFGLTLSEKQIAELVVCRGEALKATDRIEFGGGILKKLAVTFCDSPYLTRENWAETLTELQNDFYYFKNESVDRLTDNELIEAMKDVFDGPAQGSLDYLSGTSLPELCRRAREKFDPTDANTTRELF